MKKCQKCNNELPLEDFNKKQKTKDGRQAWCKECNRKRSKQYYVNNKEKHIAVIKVRQKANGLLLRNNFIQYLKQHSCVRCGFSDIRALEFDHLKDKKMCLSKMIHMGYSWENILKEIEKCQVLCANCHRIKTAEDFNHYKHRHMVGAT
jgi:hypothetical protein